jgi:predicted ATP-dependent serine protease
LDHLHYIDSSDEGQSLMQGGDGAPVRVTDLIQQNNNNNSTNKSNRRIVIPDDPEFNRVLGGGIVSGSLILVGGDPGTYGST